jgi:hypothetical protein
MIMAIARVQGLLFMSSVTLDYVAMKTFAETIHTCVMA